MFKLFLRGRLVARKELHQKLVSASQDRTKLRKETADRITHQLERDLDANVLRIEVDAQPISDQSELEEWLISNVDPFFKRYTDPRRKALLASKIMPATIRNELLTEAKATGAIFTINKPRAEDGKITAEDARSISERCRALAVVALDESDQWDKEFLESIPADIRGGIVTLSASVEESHVLRIESVLKLDEIVLNDVPEVRLNDRPLDPGSQPRPLVELSPGQRCSAILPVLLLSGDYPLVIDQPEENLDNRLIRQVIVNILASMKLRRQIIIATHNPNLPVLGDVEQCVVMQAVGRDLSTVAATGNLDSAQVSRFVTDIMEGGREAFQYRHSIYQTHWRTPVDEG